MIASFPTQDKFVSLHEDDFYKEYSFGEKQLNFFSSFAICVRLGNYAEASITPLIFQKSMSVCRYHELHNFQNIFRLKSYSTEQKIKVFDKIEKLINRYFEIMEGTNLRYLKMTVGELFYQNNIDFFNRFLITNKELVYLGYDEPRILNIMILNPFYEVEYEESKLRHERQKKSNSEKLSVTS